MRNILKGAGLVLALALSTAAAQAQSNPLVTPTGFTPAPSGGAFTMGFAFTVGANTFLNGLGAYDHLGDGFPAPMTVGLWDGAGTLLQQATVTSADPLIGSFRYTTLSSYALTAGTTYIVGAFRYAGSGETYATGFGPNSTAPGVTILGARYSDTGSFAFPNVSVGTNGYYGANALVGAAVTAGVPEPATWLMMILGFGMIGAGLRSRRTTVAYAA